MRTFASAMLISFLLSIIPPLVPAVDTLEVASVTALKESVTLERIAAPYSAIRAEQLDRSGTYRPNLLSGQIPGLHIPDYGTSMTSTIYLRGLGSRMENPVLGLYIDGIPVLDKNAYDFDWEGLRSATMLRGPQGTLYGRNAMGGVLALQTLSPADGEQRSLRLEYGTANTVRVGASFVFGHNALSASFRHTDGFFQNTTKNTALGSNSDKLINNVSGKKFGEQFETIARYMAGMLVREADGMTEFVDIIQELDDSSYDKDNQI